MHTIATSLNYKQIFTSSTHRIGITTKLTVMKEQTPLSLKALNKTIGMLKITNNQLIRHLRILQPVQISCAQHLMTTCSTYKHLL